MTLYRVTRNDFESNSIITHPSRTYFSSSISGVTGSVHLFARRSEIEKEVEPISTFIESVKNDSDLNSDLRNVQYIGKIARNVRQASGSFKRAVDGYLDKVNAQGLSVKKKKVLDVIRFTPSYTFTSNTLRKLFIKDTLNTYHRVAYPTAQWAYTNYNSLNFFTASSLANDSALLYPNITSQIQHEGYASGTYSLSGAFSFDFYINPRYTTDNTDGHFKAGTIFHLSSSYALSLVSGSAKDENGKPIGFRIKLQLSHSADVEPSIANPGLFPNNLTFLSDDNSLKFNHWHHVIVRWGTNLINEGTGSFNIDGHDKGIFVVPSGTVNLRESFQPPSALVVGNYYDGFDDMSQFFAIDPATRDGLNVMNETTLVEEPINYSFSHQLNAEVHDLAIKRYYMSNADIAISASVGPKYVDEKFAFYLPPFFVAESPFRQFVGAHGGILQTPFFEVDGTTNDPFNVALSFGVAGHYINIENFLRDFASNVFPRVHQMTGSAIPYTTTARSANDFLYDDPNVRRRNLLLLPCDDGNFVPSYELLASESVDVKRKFVDALGVEELSFITLDNLVHSQSLLFGQPFDSQDIVDEQIGFTPETPGNQPGNAYVNYVNMINKAVVSGTFDSGIQDLAPLTIYQRTKDPSSNQITIFDISNMFYGKRIDPGTLVLRDTKLSGSDDRISITLKDDGRGNVYRADCLTSASTWNSVGNIYYDEGLVLIKSPHLFFFGNREFEISFKGEQAIHVLKLDVLAPSHQLNSSSNPNWKAVRPSLDQGDVDEFVYITGLNFHDDNYNVVMKAQLAQPHLKRHDEKLMFKIKHDF